MTRTFGGGVGLAQQAQRGFQLARALADMVLQHGGTAKFLKGGVAVALALFGMAHQGIRDDQQLFDIAPGRVGGVQQARRDVGGGGHSASPRSVPGG